MNDRKKKAKERDRAFLLRKCGIWVVATANYLLSPSVLSPPLACRVFLLISVLHSTRELSCLFLFSYVWPFFSAVQHRHTTRIHLRLIRCMHSRGRVLWYKTGVASFIVIFCELSSAPKISGFRGSFFGMCGWYVRLVCALGALLGNVGVRSGMCTPRNADLSPLVVRSIPCAVDKATSQMLREI